MKLEKVPLMYCGNVKVFDGMLISLLSIIKYVKLPLDVYVLTMDLQDMNEKYIPVNHAQVGFLEGIIRKVNDQSRIHLVDVTDVFKKEMEGSPNLATNYGPYTLARLFADFVPDIPDILLYMDTDTIAHGDITEVFETDIYGYEYAAAIDYLGKFFLFPTYQNAGVLLLNMKLIKENGFFGRVREWCRTKKMFFPDQTALNRLVPKKKFFSTRFNEQRMLHKNTVIQHFSKSIRLLPFYHTINIKPWEIERMHSIYKIHAYDDILEEYLEYKKQLQSGTASA